MARISVGGGVSDARALPDQPGYIAPAVPVEEPEAAPAGVEPDPAGEAEAEPAQPAPAAAEAAPAAPSATAPPAPATTTQKGSGA